MLYVQREVFPPFVLYNVCVFCMRWNGRESEPKKVLSECRARSHTRPKAAQLRRFLLRSIVSHVGGPALARARARRTGYYPAISSAILREFLK